MRRPGDCREEIGAGVTHLAPGDHAVVDAQSFVRTMLVWRRGRTGSFAMPVFPLDQKSRCLAEGEAIVHVCGTGAFAEHVVVVGLAGGPPIGQGRAARQRVADTPAAS